jgi:starch-binding outer membrane protein, SusD/RagB family
MRNSSEASVLRRLRSETVKAASTLLVFSLVAAGTGCDLTVDNPDRVQDELLNDPGAHSAVVAGVSLALSQAINWTAFFGGDASKEFTQGGRIHPVKLPVEPGQLTVDGIPNTIWNAAQQARWVAEDAVRRLKESEGSDFSSYDLGAKALLLAGYANRLLGENMCELVVDNSAPTAYTDAFKRAETNFTEANAVANAAGDATVATAALAARASARLMLGDRANALADAAQVPTSFRFQAQYAIDNENYYNFIYWVNANQTYREISAWHTYYDAYYTDTGDPRVAWGTDPKVPTAEFPSVPWYFPLKYTARETPINLSTGREMRLVEAEIDLLNGDVAGAVDKINGIRNTVISDKTGQPLPPITATTAAEAWTALKRERGIELWLEGRRLGDERRWVENDTPGDMEDLTDRVRLCFPIALSERQTNPNVGLDHVDPKNPLYTGSLQ